MTLIFTSALFLFSLLMVHNFKFSVDIIVYTCGTSCLNYLSIYNVTASKVINVFARVDFLNAKLTRIAH